MVNVKTRLHHINLAGQATRIRINYWQRICLSTYDFLLKFCLQKNKEYILNNSSFLCSIDGEMCDIL